MVSKVDGQNNYTIFPKQSFQSRSARSTEMAFAGACIGATHATLTNTIPSLIGRRQVELTSLARPVVRSAGLVGVYFPLAQYLRDSFTVGRPNSTTRDLTASAGAGGIAGGIATIVSRPFAALGQSLPSGTIFRGMGWGSVVAIGATAISRLFGNSDRT